LTIPAEQEEATAPAGGGRGGLGGGGRPGSNDMPIAVPGGIAPGGCIPGGAMPGGNLGGNPGWGTGR